MERAEIARQALYRKVAPEHATLRAEELQEVAHHTAYGPLVPRNAEQAERRELDTGVRELSQGGYAGSLGPQTRVGSGVGQTKVLKHYWHRRSFSGDGDCPRKLRGPHQQIERESELRQRPIAVLPGRIAE